MTVDTGTARTATETVRGVFREAGYDLGKPKYPGRPYVESCRSSLVEMHGVACVRTNVVTTTPGGGAWKHPLVILDEIARNALFYWRHGKPEEVLEALGKFSHAQLVEHIEESKYAVTVPLPDAMLPKHLWEPTDTRVVEAKRGTITIAEAIAGWTVVGEHKERTVRGKPQTVRMRIRRCGCPAKKVCHCVAKPGGALIHPENQRDCILSAKYCHNRGHREGIDALVGAIGRTYR